MVRACPDAACANLWARCGRCQFHMGQIHREDAQLHSMSATCQVKRRGTSLLRLLVQGASRSVHASGTLPPCNCVAMQLAAAASDRERKAAQRKAEQAEQRLKKYEQRLAEVAAQQVRDRRFRFNAHIPYFADHSAVVLAGQDMHRQSTDFLQSMGCSPPQQPLA